MPVITQVSLHLSQCLVLSPNKARTAVVAVGMAILVALFLLQMSWFWQQGLLSNVPCPFQFRATFPILFSSLVQIWTALTALWFAVLWIVHCPNNRELSFLCFGGKMLSALCCKDLYPQRLCTHCPFRNPVIQRSIDNNRARSWVPLPPSLLDKGRHSASLMVATGPNVSVNTILGLPFMKATGMILDLVDKVVDCKYLNCPPFPVDFCRTSNHVPVMDEPTDTPVNHATSYLQLIQEVENLKRYSHAKVMAGSSKVAPKDLSIHFGMRLPVRATVINHDSSSMALHSTTDMSMRWVPPSGMPEDYDDYPASVLGKDEFS
jgi:hypothetical protein